MIGNPFRSQRTRDKLNFVNAKIKGGMRRLWEKRRVDDRILAHALCIGFLACACATLGPLPGRGASFEDGTSQLTPGLGNASSAWGDFNNDGYPDLSDGVKIWRNNGGTNFTPLTGFGSGVWGDCNNDGYPDFLRYTVPVRIWSNSAGSGSFTLSSQPAVPMNIALGGSAADFDGDGRLDYYVTGFEVEDVAYLPDVLLRNQPGMDFTNVWQESGSLRPGRGVTACDFDEDGDMDIYVSNYRLEANDLWRNAGNGTFTDAAATLGVAGDYDGWSWSYGHTIGSAWGDLDNDGHIDLFVGNFSHSDAFQDRPKFYRNKGAGGGWQFQDMSAGAGLAWQESFASPALGDYDNDGDLDLFFTTVYPGNYPVLYRNDGNWHFINVTSTEGLSGLPPTYQAAWADFDNDGDLDLVAGGKLFVNRGNTNHWLKVRLQGSGSINGSAIGAHVRVSLGSQTLTRQVEAGTGQGNQNDLTLHFGLGGNTSSVNVVVSWPNGTTQTLTGVPVDRMVPLSYNRSAGLSCSPGALAPTCARGETAASQSFDVWNGDAGGSELTYSIMDNAAWLSVSPTNGTSTGEHDTIQVNCQTASLAAGTHTATITISGSGATNSPQTIAVTLTITPAVGDLPFTDSFESYANGLLIGGTNGWMADPYGATVRTGSYTAANPPGPPLPEASHTRVLRVDEAAAHHLNGASGHNVNVDLMMLAVRVSSLPDNLSNTVHTTFCVDSNGWLNLWHMHGNGATWTQRWTILTDTPIATDQWVRVGFTMDFSTSPGGDTFFRPRLNGSFCPTAYGFAAPDNLMAPGPWYMCANNPGRGGGGALALSAIKMEGEGWYDDIVVATNAFAHTGPTTTNGVPFAWFDGWGIARNPNIDGDADGFMESEEYGAGTSPTDPESRFRVVAAWRDGDRLYVQFLGNDSGADTPFIMQRATNLAAGGWTVADASIPRATAPAITNTWSEPMPPEYPVFYRPKATY